MKVLLHEMSWVEAKEYFSKNDTAIIPVGSNEQHGPHPLGTDHLIAKAVAKETAKRTGVILPVSYTIRRKPPPQTILGHSARFTGNLQKLLERDLPSTKLLWHEENRNS